MPCWAYNNTYKPYSTEFQINNFFTFVSSFTSFGQTIESDFYLKRLTCKWQNEGRKPFLTLIHNKQNSSITHNSVFSQKFFLILCFTSEFTILLKESYKGFRFLYLHCKIEANTFNWLFKKLFPFHLPQKKWLTQK